MTTAMPLPAAMTDTAPIKIESGLPVPPQLRGSGKPTKYPWATMKPGDSFFIARTRNSAGSILTTPRYKYPGTQWTCRTATENGVKGVRIWRLA